ncbi:hypothetical protein TCAL_13396, partial [Tigriopus californicus]
FHPLSSCEKFQDHTNRERFDLSKANSCCLKCLKPSHTVKYCQTRERGGICKKPTHHTLLHRDDFSNKKTNRKQNIKSFTTRDESSSLNSSNDEYVAPQLFVNKSKESGYVAIAIGAVYVLCGKKKMKVNALFDKGCNNTTISKRVTDQLNIKHMGKPHRRTLNETTGVEVEVEVIAVNFKVASIGHHREFSKYGISSKAVYDVSAHAINRVCPGLYPVDWAKVLEKEPHLRGVKPEEASVSEVDLIIGTDYCGLLTPLETRFSQSNVKAPTAELTRLGWILMGRNETTGNKNPTNLCYKGNLASGSIHPDLYMLAKQFWEMDSPSVRSGWSSKEKMAFGKMEISHDPIKQQFEATIPWKESSGPNLPYKRNAVIQRQSRCLDTKYLDKKGCSLQEIEETFMDYKEKKYVKELPELSEDSFYLPFFPVVDRTRATNQVRLVFDAAAKYQDRSLKDQIMETPNLIRNSLHCLVSFRLRKFGIIGDISQMFNRISLAPKDRRYHRFVMVGKNGKITDYKFQVQLFGNKSVANISQKTLAECTYHLHRKPFLPAPTWMTFLTRDTEEEIMKEVEELPTLLNHASMAPRKWLSNSRAALSSIPSGDRANQAFDPNKGIINQGKILGMKWCPEYDFFLFEWRGFDELNKIDFWTKRNVLSTLFKQYDPLGLLAPYLILGKVLLQSICTTKSGWDDQIRQDLDMKWTQWIKQANRLTDVKIPRYLGFSQDKNTSVHIFVDASIDAIACCIYVVSSNSVKPLHSRLVFAKARMARNVLFKRAQEKTYLNEIEVLKTGSSYLNTTLNHFWQRLISEFLPQLHPRTKWNQEKPPLEEGNLVVLLEDQLPRGLWKIVVVDRVSQGGDGCVHQAWIRPCDGSILKRPVSKLLPLDIEPLSLPSRPMQIVNFTSAPDFQNTTGASPGFSESLCKEIGMRQELAKNDLHEKNPPRSIISHKRLFIPQGVQTSKKKGLEKSDCSGLISILQDHNLALNSIDT